MPITEYIDLAQEVRAGLAASERAIPLRIAGNASAAQVLQAVAAQPFRWLVLMLDQAERIIDLPAPAQARLMSDLTDCLETLGNALRVVFAVHEAAQPALSDLLRPLCRWPLTSIPLHSLSQQEAEEAIVKPLETLNWPVTLVPPSLAKDRIVPDLADLSGRDSRVDPGALQVVCERLYCAALASKVGRVITEHLYAKARWAEGVLAAHAEELLNQLGTDRPVGEQILASIASTRGERWMPAEQLAVSGEPAARERALGTLEDLNLVVKRQVDGRQEYAFANPIVAGKAARLLATEGQLAAEGVVDRVWLEWRDREALATRGQLRRLRIWWVPVQTLKPSQPRCCCCSARL